MRRRRNEPPSALELFLDAVCNAFGGIVLIAILLSIVVQDRTKGTEQSRQDSKAMAVEEAHEFLVNINRLQSMRLQLSESVRILKQLQPKIDQAEVVAFQEKLEQRQRDLSDVLQQQTEISQRLAQLVELTSQLRNDLEKVRDQLGYAQSALSSDQAALDKALDEQSETLKLPEVESVHKPNVILLMRHGKIYPVYQNDSKTAYDEHVMIEPIGGASKISPKSSSGWDLSSRADSTKLVDYLKAYSPSRNILSVGVWPDSYEDFVDFKRIVLDRGFQYQLWPLTDVPALIVSPTANQLPRVQ